MCGIFGIAYRDGTTIPDDALLRETGRLLGHRGPDAGGIYRNCSLGLVHTRLSLLDLSKRSDQPFRDDGNRYALVYNGEIYNFKALRTELESAGVVFRTGSDTEVLLHGIIQHGVDAFVPRLEGMFAFGVWDNERKVLTLVRDRLGIKPLAVYEDENVLIFSSEVKAMSPWLPLRPDPHMASAYLAGFGGPTRDRSFFRDVTLLAPGAVREVRLGERSTARSFTDLSAFWNQSERERLAALRPKEVVDHVEDLLIASVKKHLIADAPVGALCSGGLDSSLLLALAGKSHSDIAIFHANVKGPLSEYQAARTLSEHLGLELRTVEIRDHDFIEQLPSVIRHYEYPFSNHPSSVPFLLVSRLVRAHGVKAVLSGEGSDECFLGYRSIALQDLRQSYHRVLRRLRSLVQRVPRIGRALWPTDSGHVRLVHGLEQNFEIGLERAHIRDRIRAGGVTVSLRETWSLEWLGYHLRTLLHRNDALGMAASIEARFPYLDHDLVRAAVNLPYSYKIRPSLTAFDRGHPFLCDKWVVRAIADRYLPRALSRRIKLGFPTNAYERTNVSSALLQGGFVADLYGITEPVLKQLFEAADRSFRVRLMMLEVWGRLFCRGESEAELLTALFSHTSIDPTPA